MQLRVAKHRVQKTVLKVLPFSLALAQKTLIKKSSALALSWT